MGVTTSMAAMIMSVCPLVVAAAAVPLLKERLIGWQWFGLAAGLAGMGSRTSWAPIRAALGLSSRSLTARKALTLRVPVGPIGCGA